MLSPVYICGRRTCPDGLAAYRVLRVAILSKLLGTSRRRHPVPRLRASLLLASSLSPPVFFGFHVFDSVFQALVRHYVLQFMFGIKGFTKAVTVPRSRAPVSGHRVPRPGSMCSPFVLYNIGRICLASSCTTIFLTTTSYDVFVYWMCLQR